MSHWQLPGRGAGRRAACAAAGLVLGWALGGCSSTPAPRFHSLTPAPAAGAANKVAPAGSVAWEVLPVTVPPGVDQPQWVLRSVDGSLVVLEQERWVGPLAEEVRSAVAVRLTQTLGAPATRTPAWRVRIDLQRFEAAPGREARIDATWSVVGDAGAAAVLRCRGEFVQVPASESYPALSASLQAAVGRLADAIAAGLKSLAAGQPGVCEG